MKFKIFLKFLLISGVERAPFPENELFHGFSFKNFAYLSGINI